MNRESANAIPSTTSPEARKLHSIVLLGIGHTNAHILKMWRRYPIANAELICVSNFPTATYSGMLPGVLAGQYAPEDMQIDLRRLAASSGAKLIVGDVVGVDRDHRQLLFSERPPLRYDLLAIGIGSVPRPVPGVDKSQTVLPIKPMQTFLPRLSERLRETVRERESKRPIEITVVGGGAGGCEIMCCLPGLLSRVVPNHACQLRLIHGGSQLLEGFASKTSERMREILRQRGVALTLNRKVTRIVGNQLHLDDGTASAADVVLWATSAIAPSLLGHLQLREDDRGFLVTRNTLQTAEDDRVFVVGDSGSQIPDDPPKSGVYAVRQGPYLWQNLVNRIQGQPLLQYRPQLNFLKLLNLGDGTALGEWRGFSFRGKWVAFWKDRIDKKFLAPFKDDSHQTSTENEIS